MLKLQGSSYITKFISSFISFILIIFSYLVITMHTYSKLGQNQCINSQVFFFFPVNKSLAFIYLLHSKDNNFKVYLHTRKTQQVSHQTRYDVSLIIAYQIRQVITGVLQTCFDEYLICRYQTRQKIGFQIRVPCLLCVK